MSLGRAKSIAGQRAWRHGLTRRGLLLLVLGAAARRANAGAPPPAVAATAGTGTGFSAEGLAAIDAVQRVQLVALLEAARVPHGPLLGKPWPRRKQTYLVAALDAESSDDRQRFHIVAFDLAGQSVRLVARWSALARQG